MWQRYRPAYKQNVLIKALYPMSDIKALTFHPTAHQNFESISVLVCMCIIILGLRLTKIKPNPTQLTQITLLTYQHRKQAFPVVVLPQRVTPVAHVSNGYLSFQISFILFFSFFFLVFLFHSFSLFFIFLSLFFFNKKSK